MTIIDAQQTHSQNGGHLLKNTITKLRGNLGLFVAALIFGIAYAIPKMISAPSTILVLFALAYALALVYWAFNLLPWRDDAMRQKAIASAQKLTKTN